LNLQSLLGDNWDETTNRQNALQTAQTEVQANPLNAFAWFNVGSNLTYLEHYADAAKAYDRARQIGLPQRMLRYQFGPFVAYFQSGRIDDLVALTQYALERTPNSEEALLWRGWALYRRGDRTGAESAFQQALQYHPGYTDAINAINYLHGK
jgi:tetratricopeptide (TPR) repeat protein